MDIRTVMETIQDTFSSIVQKRNRSRLLTYALIALGIAGLAVTSFFAYRWYVMYRERAAYKALTQYLEDYRRTQSEQDADWAPIEDLFKLGYEQHSSSYLAPFFIAFEADVLIQQNKKVEAVQVLDQMINKLNTKDPLLPLFKVKRALLKLDLSDSVAQESGVQELIALGNDTKNECNDVALYYLGQYYFATDKINDAKQVWQQLVEQQQHEKIMPSPWAELARYKLDQLA